MVGSSSAVRNAFQRVEPPNGAHMLPEPSTTNTIVGMRIAALVIQGSTAVSPGRFPAAADEELIRVARRSIDGGLQRAIDTEAGLELEMFDEEEADGVTPRGNSKHWHIFHIVARKP